MRGQVASTTLALEEFGAENIPYLYIVVAGANVIAIPILTWIGTRCGVLSALPLRANVCALTHASCPAGAQVVSKSDSIWDRLGDADPAWNTVVLPGID